MKNPVIATLLALTTLTFLAQETALGSLIVNFENDAALAGDTSIAAAATHANVTSSALANGPGVSAWGWPDAAAPLGFFGNVNLADAIANNDFLSFTLTPDVGQQINFGNFFVRISVNVGTSIGDNDIDLLSSLTGFTAANSLATYQPTTPADSTVTTSVFNTNLSGIAALQGVTGPVEFRLYMSDIGNRLGIGQAFATNGADDLRIDGTVSAAAAVPEPAGFLLMGLAGLFGAVQLRTRSAKQPAK